MTGAQAVALLRVAIAVSATITAPTSFQNSNVNSGRIVFLYAGDPGTGQHNGKT